MKKVVVKDLDGIETHGAIKEDPTAWISECVENNIWGKKAGEYPLSQLSESELAQEISRKTHTEAVELEDPLIELPEQFQYHYFERCYKHLPAESTHYWSHL